MPDPFLPNLRVPASQRHPPVGILETVCLCVQDCPRPQAGSTRGRHRIVRVPDWSPRSCADGWWFTGSCLQPHHCRFVPLQCDWPCLAQKRGSTDRRGIRTHRVPPTGAGVRCISGRLCCANCVLPRWRLTDGLLACALWVGGPVVGHLAPVGWHRPILFTCSVGPLWVAFLFLLSVGFSTD